MSEEAPEELSTVWDPEIRSAYLELEPRQQKFLLAYVGEWNGAEAYRQAYNQSAKDNVAAACGSRLLTNANIKRILKRFEESRLEDLFLCRRTFTQAALNAVKPIYVKDKDGVPEKVEDLEDHDVRVRAADKLAHLSRLYEPPESDPENPDKPAGSKKVISFGGVKIEVS